MRQKVEVEADPKSIQSSFDSGAKISYKPSPGWKFNWCFLVSVPLGVFLVVGVLLPWLIFFPSGENFQINMNGIGSYSTDNVQMQAVVASYKDENTKNLWISALIGVGGAIVVIVGLVGFFSNIREIKRQTAFLNVGIGFAILAMLNIFLRSYLNNELRNFNDGNGGKAIFGYGFYIIEAVPVLLVIFAGIATQTYHTYTRVRN